MCSAHLAQSVFRGFADMQAAEGGLSVGHPKRQLESGARLGSGPDAVSMGSLQPPRAKGGGRQEEEGRAPLTRVCSAPCPHDSVQCSQSHPVL